MSPHSTGRQRASATATENSAPGSPVSRETDKPRATGCRGQMANDRKVKEVGRSHQQ